MRKTDEQTALQPGALAVGVLCESVRLGLAGEGTHTARGFLLWGALWCGAAMLCCLLLQRLFRQESLWLCIAAWATVAVLAVWGLVGTAGQVFALCRDVLPNSFLWAAAAMAVLAVWGTAAPALNGAGWALRCLTAAALVLLVAGVWRQLCWRNLALEAWGGPSGILRFYPEYAAACLFCPPKKRAAWALPAVDYAVRGGLLLLLELVFGHSLAGRLGAGELARVWSWGIFSRFDAPLQFLWLMLAFYRVALLSWCLKETLAALIPERERRAAL